MEKTLKREVWENDICHTGYDNGIDAPAFFAHCQISDVIYTKS